MALGPQGEGRCNLFTADRQAPRSGGWSAFHVIWVLNFSLEFLVKVTNRCGATEDRKKGKKSRRQKEEGVSAFAASGY